MQNIEQYCLTKKLKKFLNKGWIHKNDSILVVCASKFEMYVLDHLGFENYTLTSMFEDTKNEIKNYQMADAMNLPFENKTYDHVIVHAGLHHCSSPHLALVEMYRVAKKTAIFFEAQDSIFMRFLVKYGFALDYELDAVIDDNGKSGGVNNSHIPNFIYRWTKRETEKTIRTYDPTQEPVIYYEREFFFYEGHLDGFLSKHILTKILGITLMKFFAKCVKNLVNFFFPSQGNTFIAVICKEKGKTFPWLKKKGEDYIFVNTRVQK